MWRFSFRSSWFVWTSLSSSWGLNDYFKSDFIESRCGYIRYVRFVVCVFFAAFPASLEANQIGRDCCNFVRPFWVNVRSDCVEEIGDFDDLIVFHFVPRGLFGLRCL